MRECAPTDKVRIRRKYSSGIRCPVGLFPLIFLPGMLSHQEYPFSQSREKHPDMVSKRVDMELVDLKATAHNGKGNLYTVAIFDENNPDRNLRALKPLARATRGEEFFPASAEDVVPICKRIAHDIPNQDSIAYQPTDTKQDGSFRAIHVTAKAGDARHRFARTRAGYCAPLKSQPLPMSVTP